MQCLRYSRYTLNKNLSLKKQESTTGKKLTCLFFQNNVFTYFQVLVKSELPLKYNKYMFKISLENLSCYFCFSFIQ